MSSHTEETTLVSIDARTTFVPSMAVRQTASRFFFVDQVCVVLTILAILHHLSATYNGIIPTWYYLEVTNDQVTIILLTIFMLINQSFFMSCFFLISGYVLSGLYDRNGARAFLRDCFQRLGIPLLIFSVVIGPTLSYLGLTTSTAPEVRQWLKMPYWMQYGFLISPGPLWFVEALLLFACLYTFWRKFPGKSSREASDKHLPPFISTNTPPTLGAIAVFTLLLAVMIFLVRIWFPYGRIIPLVNIIPSNLPQYIGFFIIGCIASRRNWFLSTPSSMGKIGVGAAIGATVFLFPLAVSDISFLGGMHWQAFVFALWEAIMSVGISLGLLVLSKEHKHRQRRLGKFLATQAYVAYIIHAPVIVCLTYAVRDVHLHPLLKFGLVALLAVPLCFGCGYLLRKLPVARTLL